MSGLSDFPRSFYPSLDRQIAVVTGAAGGIGGAIADELWFQGAHVIATDIKPIETERNERFITILGDITDPRTHDRLLEASKSLGGISILINNAALVDFGADICVDPPEIDTQNVFAVNFHAPRKLGHAAAKQILEVGSEGSIIFITSVHASLVRMQEHYHAAKAATEALMREMAMQYGPLMAFV
jgi:NAD(P)-dependent dehydrogenase (short-subunit alcohol dehydrogenase family)